MNLIYFTLPRSSITLQCNKHLVEGLTIDAWLLSQPDNGICKATCAALQLETGSFDIRHVQLKLSTVRSYLINRNISTPMHIIPRHLHISPLDRDDLA
jgi:hypothetical protein